jgi:hypothetical protein
MITIHDVEQCSPEWYRARMGLPTASEFKVILREGANGSASKTRDEYLRKLAGELLTDEPRADYSNQDMERGKAMEPEARAFYDMIADEPVRRVGFITNGRKGCSPDALVGDVGMLEIKTAFPHILIGYLLKDEFPTVHKAQCQGALWVAEREWIDLEIYWPKLPPFIRRAQRDEPYIDKLARAVDEFNAELDAVVAQVRAYRGDKVAA